MNTVLKGEVKSPLREVRLRVATLFALIMLSSDSLNPVKIFCEIVSIDTKWLFLVFLCAFIGIIIVNIRELVYFSIKVFFHSLLTIFLSSMEVLGRENIPTHGPVIFTGNHMNQFVDGIILMVTAPKKVSFLIAEKSLNTPIIGDFAKAAGAIPVARPQDKARRGPGMITFEGMKVYGREGTLFTKLKKGDKIRPGKSPEAYRIKTVISDTEGILGENPGEGSPLAETECIEGRYVAYEILEYIDQSSMFDRVQSSLGIQGSCLGIFPEGGSHDRTDLLPLKAGIAAIALGVQEKYNITVPIVPVGLNYFRGHEFRGRCVIEFGAPVVITPEIMDVYNNTANGGRQAGYQALLQEVTDGMRSVIVTAKDYNELKLIHTIRRLYQGNSLAIPTKTKQDLARRFSTAVKLLHEKYDDKLPQDLQLLKEKLEGYQSLLDYWGLKDYRLQKASLEMSYFSTLYTFCHGATILMVFSYWGVMAVEASMNDLKDLRPAFLRLLPSFRIIAAELPSKRQELVKEVREMVKKYGPMLGAVYNDSSEQWEMSVKKSNSMGNIAAYAAAAAATHAGTTGTGAAAQAALTTSTQSTAAATAQSTVPAAPIASAGPAVSSSEPSNLDRASSLFNSLSTMSYEDPSVSSSSSHGAAAASRSGRSNSNSQQTLMEAGTEKKVT